MITTLATLLIPFIVLTILNSSVVIVTGKTFGKCLPVTMMGIVYILYFSQIVFNTFLYGFILIGLFPVVILLLIIGRRIVPEYDLIMTDGLIAFIIIYVFFNILNFNKWVLICDEFTHWGPMVKEMIKLDRLYLVPESFLRIHKEYPPFMAIFEFFWVKICGHYSEMGTTTALDVFQLSIVTVPFLEKRSFFRKEDWIRPFLRFAAFLLIVVVFDPTCILTTVYKDLALPLIFAYSIYILISGEALLSFFGLISFMMSLGALVLTKELGIAFAALSIAAFNFFTIRDYMLKKLSGIRTFIYLVLILSFTGIVLLSWKKQVSCYLGDSFKQFDLSKVRPEMLLWIVRGSDQNIQTRALHIYAKALIKDPISEIVAFSYITAFAAVLMIAYFLWKKYKEKMLRSDFVGLNLIFVSGTIGFAFTMSVLYIFCFSEEEMLELTCYSRYMSSYVLGEILIIAMLFFKFWNEDQEVGSYLNQALMCLIVVFLMTFAPATTTWIPQSMRKGPFKTVNAEVAEQAYEYADRIKEHTEKGTDILLLTGDSGWFTSSYTRYLVNDRLIDYTESVDDFRTISKNDYLLIINIEPNTESTLSPLCNGRQLKENVIYRIVNDNGDLRLVETE